MSKINRSALRSDLAVPGGFIGQILGQRVQVFKHDLPEFAHKKPWVAQTEDVKFWAYSDTAQGACRSLRVKLDRVKHNRAK